MLINSPHKATRPLDLLLVPLPNCAAALNEFRHCPNEEPDSGAQLGGELVRRDGAPVAPARVTAARRSALSCLSAALLMPSGSGGVVWPPEDHRRVRASRKGQNFDDEGRGPLCRDGDRVLAERPKRLANC